jgi:hypothetical protein
MTNFLTLAAAFAAGSLALFAILSYLGTKWMNKVQHKPTKRQLRKIASFRGKRMGWVGATVYAGQFDNDAATLLLESIGIICKVVNVNVASIGATSVGVGTVAVTGLTPSHRCFVSSAAAPSVSVAVVGGRCATAGTLTIDAVNPSAGALDLAAQNFNLLAIPGDLN